MKPLPSAPLTLDDVAIWLAVNGRAPGYRVGMGGSSLSHSSILADRRDADLMLEAGWHRAQTFPIDVPPLRLRSNLYGIDCGGAHAEFAPKCYLDRVVTYPTAHKRQ